MEDPLKTQVAGSHYKDMPIQPVQFIHANKIPFIEGCVIKYVCRHRSKNGRQDIEKAIHFLQLLLDQEYANVPTPEASQAHLHPYSCPKCGGAPLTTERVLTHKCATKATATPAVTWDWVCEVCGAKVRAGIEHLCPGKRVL